MGSSRPLELDADLIRLLEERARRQGTTVGAVVREGLACLEASEAREPADRELPSPGDVGNGGGAESGRASTGARDASWGAGIRAVKERLAAAEARGAAGEVFAARPTPIVDALSGLLAGTGATEDEHRDELERRHR